MKNYFLFFFLVFIWASCCPAKDIACKECREFNKYIQENWVYDKASKRAYINASANDYGVKKSMDKLKKGMKCWEGMKVSKLEKILPFPTKGVKFRKDWFHVIVAKECFECSIKNIGCEDQILKNHPCDLQNFIIQMTAQDIVKKVDFVINNNSFGLEIK